MLPPTLLVYQLEACSTQSILEALLCTFQTPHCQKKKTTWREIWWGWNAIIFHTEQYIDMHADGVCLTSFVHGQNLVSGTYCLSGGLHGEILLGYMCSKSTKQLNLYGLKMINTSHLIKNLLTVSMSNIPLTALQSYLQLTILGLLTTTQLASLHSQCGWV